MNKKNKFILTDDDSFQIVRKLDNNNFELYQINEEDKIRENPTYYISHAVIDPSEYDYVMICDCSGYESVEKIKEEYKEDADLFMAELTFELQACDHIVKSGLSYNKAKDLIKKMSGYKDDQQVFDDMEDIKVYVVTLFKDNELTDIYDYGTYEDAYKFIMEEYGKTLEEREGSDAWKECKDLGYCPILGEHSNPTIFDCEKLCPGRNGRDTHDCDHGYTKRTAWCENKNGEMCQWTITPIY